MIALENEDLLKSDQSKLYSIYEKWPQYFRDIYHNNKETVYKLDHESSFYRSIILCGMGASGTACDILNDILHRLGPVPTSILKGQDMPSYVDKHTLVIVNSVSGDTLEAISSLEQAAKRAAEVVSISSGGVLRDKSLKYGYRHITIPQASHSRASLPYLLMPALRVIAPFLSAPISQDMSRISDNLSDIHHNISISMPFESNTAKQVAAFLNEGFAFCYTSPLLLSVGTRFKNSLNENAKVHCVRESILEASHNEIVPFTYHSKGLIRRAFLVSWKYENNISRQRFKKIRSLFNQINQPVMEMKSPYRSLINAIICSIYLLDISTLYLAVSRQIDPAPTPAIDILKGIQRISSVLDCNSPKQESTQS